MPVVHRMPYRLAVISRVVIPGMLTPQLTALAAPAPLGPRS